MPRGIYADPRDVSFPADASYSPDYFPGLVDIFYNFATRGRARPIYGEVSQTNNPRTPRTPSSPSSPRPPIYPLPSLPGAPGEPGGEGPQAPWIPQDFPGEQDASFPWWIWVGQGPLGDEERHVPGGVEFSGATLPGDPRYPFARATGQAGTEPIGQVAPILRKVAPIIIREVGRRVRQYERTGRPRRPRRPQREVPIEKPPILEPVLPVFWPGRIEIPGHEVPQPLILPEIVVTPSSRPSPLPAPSPVPGPLPGPVTVPSPGPLPVPSPEPIPAPGRSPAVPRRPSTAPGTAPGRRLLPFSWPSFLPLPLSLPSTSPRPAIGDLPGLPGIPPIGDPPLPFPSGPGPAPGPAPGTGFQPGRLTGLNPMGAPCACPQAARSVRRSKRGKHKRRECGQSRTRDTRTGRFTTR